MPLVSVILPVYNAGPYIERAVKSILAQTLSDFELVIISNGSNAETLQKLARFSDTRIKTIHLPYPDIVDASNAGIDAASGKYIARMDADDYSVPSRLEKQWQFLENNRDFDAVSSLITYEGDHAKNYGYYLHVEWLNSLIHYRDIFENRFVDLPVANPSLMVKRELFRKYGHYKQGPFPEDYELVLRWLHHGTKIGKVEEPLLHWLDHSMRMSRNDDRYDQDAFFRIKTEYFAQWMRQNHPEKQEVLVWGTGKSVKRKCRFLQEHGLEIAGFIDVRDVSTTHPPTFRYTSFPPGKFILSYVGDRKGRVEIFRYLTTNGLRQGIDFYMMN